MFLQPFLRLDVRTGWCWAGIRLGRCNTANSKWYFSYIAGSTRKHFNFCQREIGSERLLFLSVVCNIFSVSSLWFDFRWDWSCTVFPLYQSTTYNMFCINTAGFPPNQKDSGQWRYKTTSVYLRLYQDCSSTHNLSSSAAHSRHQNLIIPNGTKLDSQNRILSPTYAHHLFSPPSSHPAGQTSCSVLLPRTH